MLPAPCRVMNPSGCTVTFWLSSGESANDSAKTSLLFNRYRGFRSVGIGCSTPNSSSGPLLAEVDGVAVLKGCCADCADGLANTRGMLPRSSTVECRLHMAMKRDRGRLEVPPNAKTNLAACEPRAPQPRDRRMEAIFQVTGILSSLTSG